MRNSHSFIFIAFVSIFLASCSEKVVGDLEKLPKVKPVEIFSALDSLSETRPNSFYAKVATKYKDSLRSQSFKTTVRSKSDSLMKFTITFLKIPFVHALFSNEIVQVSNRKDKCYIKKAVHNFSSDFGIDLQLKNLEQIILGLPLGYNSDKKYFIERDPYSYTVASHSKLQIATFKKKQKREVVIHYTLNEDLTRLKTVRINSFYDSTEAVINYSGIKEAEGFNFPENTEVRINSPKGEISINLSYSKVRVNKEENFSFVIPESYEPCP